MSRIYHSKYQNKGKEKYHVPLSLLPLKKNKNIKKYRKEKVAEYVWDMGQNNWKHEKRRTYQTTTRT